MTVNPGLNGKIALITGANHGIGAATAQALAAQGARVFIHYLRLPDDSMADPDTPGAGQYAAHRAQSADEVLDTIRFGGGTAEAGEFDLSDPAVIPHLFDAVESALGPVDILVNNAADPPPIGATSTRFPPARMTGTSLSTAAPARC